MWKLCETDLCSAETLHLEEHAYREQGFYFHTELCIRTRAHNRLNADNQIEVLRPLQFITDVNAEMPFNMVISTSLT